MTQQTARVLHKSIDMRMLASTDLNRPSVGNTSHLPVAEVHNDFDLRTVSKALPFLHAQLQNVRCSVWAHGRVLFMEVTDASLPCPLPTCQEAGIKDPGVAIQDEGRKMHAARSRVSIWGWTSPRDLCPSPISDTFGP